MTADGVEMARAALSVGEVETVYRRAGFGAPVVLLGLRAETERSWVARLTQAGSARRALVPDRTTLTALAADPAPEGSTFGAWLSGFLQGLGLDRPDVVAAAAFGEELARYAELHPDDLGRVVIVSDQEPSDTQFAELSERR